MSMFNSTSEMLCMLLHKIQKVGQKFQNLGKLRLNFNVLTKKDIDFVKQRSRMYFSGRQSAILLKHYA